MAGENPAQAVALVGAAGKLFGMQLNDAHVKLGAEVRPAGGLARWWGWGAGLEGTASKPA